MEKKIDKRKYNGGARKNSGRKSNLDKERLELLKSQIANHALEEVEIVKKGKTKEVIKKTRTLFLLDMLFTEAMQSRNILAAKEYLNRTIGSPDSKVDISSKVDKVTHIVYDIIFAGGKEDK